MDARVHAPRSDVVHGAAWRTLVAWPGMRGEPKLAWQLLWEAASFAVGKLVVTAAWVGDKLGTSERSGLRALEALERAGLIEVADRLGGRWTVYVLDPLVVARARRGPASDPQTQLGPMAEHACGESSPADSAEVGAGEARGLAPRVLSFDRTADVAPLPPRPAEVAQHPPREDIDINPVFIRDMDITALRSSATMSMSAHGGSGATSAGRGGSGATSAASIAGEFLASLDGRQAEREAEERRLVERLWGEYADAASRPAPFERIGQLVATREVHPRELARIERYVRERVPRDKRSAALVGSFKARCRELGVAWQRQK